jgi:hypothetical protein
MTKFAVLTVIAAGLVAGLVATGSQGIAGTTTKKTKPWFTQQRDRSVQTGPYGH